VWQAPKEVNFEIEYEPKPIIATAVNGTDFSVKIPLVLKNNAGIIVDWAIDPALDSLDNLQISDQG
jgi:hypothetical protein